MAEVEDAPLDGAGQGLASGMLGVGDVYQVSTDAPMFVTARRPFVLRRLAPGAAVKVVVGTQRNGRYRVEHAGMRGWMLAEDLTLVHAATDPALGCARLDALSRARAAMGFSYWWSNARWPTSGGALTWPTSNVGTCSGACPSCTHTASGDTEYGADCSGFVSTIWGFPDEDSMSNPVNNGFGTVAYNRDNSSWVTVATASALPADAMVQYVDGGTKHIFLLASPSNAVGRATTYECRSCALGCVAGTRDLSAAGWHAIRRMTPGWDDAERYDPASCERVEP